MFDGTDVTRMGLAAVRRKIGFVPQDAFLFSASLADNVALGHPDELREASYALGVPKWKTIVKVVLPTSIAGIRSLFWNGLTRKASAPASRACST